MKNNDIISDESKFNNLPSNVVYLKIYDRQMSLKEFQRWMDFNLEKAYNKGVYDSDLPPDYDDVSKSAYD